ncbi:MAG: NAD(P)/FAD-dependent oxidoreductase [Nitrospinae bacterium]|nr:NAD(P)/FAD-dependent oxidoreductase [Nitrospinota bacterium]
MSGLAAGIRMARYGGKTAIFERHSRPGGLNSFYNSGGYNLDVGLHAMTNYVSDGTKSAPLMRLLRQLRIPFDSLLLAPQMTSKIAFPGVSISFSNDFGLFMESAAAAFPAQKDNLAKLVKAVTEYDAFNLERRKLSGREVLNTIITDPLLAEMILCPVMFYGSAEEGDVEFGQFAVMFRSLFLEGLARPQGGIRTVLGLLQNAFMDAGGSIKLGSGVSKIIAKDGKVAGVVTDDGDEIECGAVLSSAGLLETIALCPEAKPANGAAEPRAGRVSFMETVNVLDTPPAELGVDASIIFYNDSDTFTYANPAEPVDLRSAVICMPDNFAGAAEDYHMLRVTNIANCDFWIGVDEMEYVKAKETWRSRSFEAAGNAIGGVTSGNVVFSDVFTPRTVRRFTDKVNGAVYGSPDKVTNGKTTVEGLYICGTDQGFLGIVGSMLSGVTVANMALTRATQAD